MNYPIQYIYYESGIVVMITTIYTPDATSTGPIGSTEYQMPSPDYTIQPGWIVTLDNLNQPIFTAP
jgi:hypothetical protein